MYNRGGSGKQSTQTRIAKLAATYVGMHAYVGQCMVLQSLFVYFVATTIPTSFWVYEILFIIKVPMHVLHLFLQLLTCSPFHQEHSGKYGQLWQEWSFLWSRSLASLSLPGWGGGGREDEKKDRRKKEREKIKEGGGSRGGGRGRKGQRKRVSLKYM